MTFIPFARNAMYTLLCAGFVVMAGCNKSATPTQTQIPASAASAPSSAQSPADAASAPVSAQTATGAPQAAYAPPTADQLYQMVAPIALFPDKLVAQVLAGSTYPDQITAAEGVIQQNPNLKGDALQTAIAQQPWDPSVKGLTAFPTVLSQMAGNIDWTTSLGDAYANDPTDVMNAIQVMRQRASSNGNLRSSPQLTVQTQAASPVDDTSDGSQAVYSVVPLPSQVIEIQPGNPDTVYVPQYNPQVVYGGDVPYYPGYTYEQPRGYSGGEIVAAGAIGFGAAILVGSLFSHHHDRGYGWNNWGMNWRGHARGGPGGGYAGRPAVVYNNTTYVSHSTTIINRNTTNNRYLNNRTVNNAVANNRPESGPKGALPNGRPKAVPPRAGGMTPRFAPTVEPRALSGNTRPGAARATQGPMTTPHFTGVPQRSVTPAKDGRGAGAGRSSSPRPFTKPAAQPHPPATQARSPHSTRPSPAPRANPPARQVAPPRPAATPHPVAAARGAPIAQRRKSAPRPQAQVRNAGHPAPHPAAKRKDDKHKDDNQH